MNEYDKIMSELNLTVDMVDVFVKRYPQWEKQIYRTLRNIFKEKEKNA
jgi:predicted ATP-binding protein involved in virulence